MHSLKSGFKKKKKTLVPVFGRLHPESKDGLEMTASSPEPEGWC